MKTFTAAALSLLLAAGVTLPAVAADASETATRDWAAIDTNKDGSISPEEMEVFLKSVWEKKG